MPGLPDNPSESFRRRNPHLYPPAGVESTNRGRWADTSKRLRQSSKPKLNKLETEWFTHLMVISDSLPHFPRPRAQAVRFQLANGVTYTPDVFVTLWPRTETFSGPIAWEVKGKHAWDDAIVKIKVAAHEWPEIQWVLVWKDGTQWREQTILG